MESPAPPPTSLRKHDLGGKCSLVREAGSSSSVGSQARQAQDDGACHAEPPRAARVVPAWTCLSRIPGSRLARRRMIRGGRSGRGAALCEGGGRVGGSIMEVIGGWRMRAGKKERSRAREARRRGLSGLEEGRRGRDDPAVRGVGSTKCWSENCLRRWVHSWRSSWTSRPEIRHARVVAAKALRPQGGF